MSFFDQQINRNCTTTEEIMVQYMYMTEYNK